MGPSNAPLSIYGRVHLPNGETIDRSIKGMQGAAGVLESNSPSKAVYIGVGGSS